ncbi:type VI secretion system baseplate subunit TssF [Orrella daihaiensis]|uniref:Type VI secretion system baseplate subunit TssF n=1 Tax=Orrella daihaiensis TaxID=2782176 RepID=A0ABY4APT1_9BURK|nr:type VI secretion system baseplate subunit TssF [Orrella daihaiensis]UOD50074.1 type VI secretion system baseplate subunit TssF [Orrella daihaiensis]
MATDYKAFYSDELRRLRHYSQEFARDNPAIAPMLGTPAVDPDIERLLEGVAFLNGHTRQKLQDEFPEIAQELTSILMPQILRPVPAATMMVFEPKASLKEAALIPAGTELAARPVDGVSCRFATTVDLQIDQVSLRSVQWRVTDSGERFLRLEVSAVQGTQGIQVPDRLRFFLGDNPEVAANLLMFLQYYGERIELVDRQAGRIRLNQGLAFPGFDEALVPQPDNGMPGFGLIRELLFFPEKFLYVEFCGLSDVAQKLSGPDFALEVTIRKSAHALPELAASSFMINVVPAVNLFSQSAEPVNVTHEIPDYLVLPDGLARQHHQIYSIDSVIGLRQGDINHRPYIPFSWMQFDASKRERTYRASIKPAMSGDWVETYLSLAYEPDEVPRPETLSIELTCTNRWLPERLKLGDVCEPTNTSPERCSFRNITSVKGAVDAPIGEDLLWSCISHTALNFMSLGNTDTARSLLRLYNSFRTNDHTIRLANDRQIEGILSVVTQPETRVYRGAVIRGQVVSVMCDQSNWPSVGAMYLWGCVLARFFATYASINVYTRFEMKDRNTGVEFKWPAMLGTKPLI